MLILKSPRKSVPGALLISSMFYHLVDTVLPIIDNGLNFSKLIIVSAANGLKRD
jgi:hypothetical protein